MLSAVLFEMSIQHFTIDCLSMSLRNASLTVCKEPFSQLLNILFTYLLISLQTCLILLPLNCAVCVAAVFWLHVYFFTFLGLILPVLGRHLNPDHEIL